MCNIYIILIISYVMVVPTNIVCGDTYYYKFLTVCVFLSNNITCIACLYSLKLNGLLNVV